MSERRKWEYTVVEINPFNHYDRPQLTVMGSEGWEIVCANDEDRREWLFKREATNE